MTTSSGGSDIADMGRRLAMEAAKAAGVVAIDHVMSNHAEQILRVRRDVAVDDTDLLSDNILSTKVIRGNADLKGIQEDIASLHKKMRYIIEETAAEIERGQYKDAEEALNKMSLSAKQREKGKALHTADNKYVTSLQSINVAMEVFQHVNEKLGRQLDAATSDPVSERDLLLANAVLVYEANDFLIDYLENFRIQGIGDIDRIHDEALRDLNNQKSELEELRRDAEATDIPEDTRRATLSHADYREQAIERAIREWAKVIERNDRAKEGVNEAQKYLPPLRLMRRNAQGQVAFMQSAALLQIVNQNQRTLDSTVNALQGIQLNPLTTETINRLFGSGG